MTERSRTFAEIKDLWRAVHEAVNRDGVPALDHVYLEGMEEVLDWLMADTCPNGDTRARRSPPLTNGFDWTLMLVPGCAAKDARDENGAVYFTPPNLGRARKAGAEPSPQDASGPPAVAPAPEPRPQEGPTPA